MLSRKDAIGIFDSGVGGLTVLSEVRKKLPSENLLYLGDTARVPYGSKSKEIVQLYSLQSAHFLHKKGVKAIVVACNSASACAIPLLRRTFPGLPITGVIVPGVQAALKLSIRKRVGVIGTEMTIRSQAYRKELNRAARGISIFDRPCPLLVPLVEEGMTSGALADKVLEYYLQPLKKNKIDTLILGCTHYPLLKKAMQKLLGNSLTRGDAAYEAANGIALSLPQLDLLNKRRRKARTTFYVTDTAEKFRRLARRFAGRIQGAVHKVSVD